MYLSIHIISIATTWMFRLVRRNITRLSRKCSLHGLLFNYSFSHHCLAYIVCLVFFAFHFIKRYRTSVASVNIFVYAVIRTYKSFELKLICILIGK